MGKTTKTAKQRRPAKRSSTDFEERLYRKLRRSGPFLTDAQVDEIEQTEQDPRNHTWRRAALAVLRMPCEELFGKIDAAHETAVVLAETAKGIRGYTSGLRELARILDVAQVRIEIGLCKRDDYDEVLAEAKVERKASKRLSHRNAAEAPHG
jgi:hypothetical protein